MAHGVYICDTLQFFPMPELTNDKFQDSVWCKIITHNHHLIVGSCYRSTSSTKENNNSLLQLLEKAIRQAYGSKILIFGDFNYPDINYDRYEVHGGPDTDAHKFF